MYLGCAFGGVGRALDIGAEYLDYVRPHCCPSLSLLSRAGVMRADISTILSARSTETGGKAKLQPWPGTGSKLAETPEK